MRPGPRVRRANPVLQDLQDLLAHRDRRGLRAQRVLPDRLRSDCQAVTCRGECNEGEVLVVAYCGPRRSAGKEENAKASQMAGEK